MASNTVKYAFGTGDPLQQYVDDFGRRQVFNPVARMPSDATEQMILSTILCIGADTRDEPIPCTESNFRPRKVVFRRSNGNSFSLVMPRIALLKERAQCVIDIFKETAYPVVCLEYIGEEWDNIYPQFNVSTEAKNLIPPIEPTNSTGKNTVYYSGYMLEYQAESGQVYSQVRQLPFKSQTREAGEVLEELSSYFSSCVGDVSTNFCAGSNYIEYRRFIAKFLTGGGGALTGTELDSVTVPSQTPDQDNLRSCAELLVQAQGLICLEYKGEINKKFHLEGFNLDV